MDVTIVLFFVAVIVRGVMMAYRNRSKHQARLTLMQDDAVKITIPTTLNWIPGQHVFIRFPSIRKFESHPFTITSIPTSKITSSLSGDAEVGDTEKNEIVVLLRPHTGLTLELAKATKDMTVTIPAILDGPYGHVETSFRAYDEVLLLVAGSGVSCGILVLMDLVQCMNGSPGESRCVKVELVWVMRKEGNTRSQISKETTSLDSPSCVVVVRSRPECSYQGCKTWFRNSLRVHHGRNSHGFKWEPE